MKKPIHAAKTKRLSPPKISPDAVAPLEEDTPLLENPDEPELAADRFAVVGRDEEAASSGHRVEPIEEDDERNAEKLIEEGLHGYVRASPNRPHRDKE